MSVRNRFAAVLLLLALSLSLSVGLAGRADAAETKKMIYDEAGLLTSEQAETLNELANEYAEKRETDMLVVTSANAANADVKKMAEDFYDKQAPGYDKPHGNAVILMMDMKNREIYLAGFYKAKTYLDDSRLDQIRGKISPDLTSGDYETAFRTYMKTAYRYMGVRPGVNPDNLLFNTWFQLAVSVVLAVVIVAAMVFRSGGRITVQRQTYEDASESGVLDHRDQYIRTTVTKRKIEKNRGGGGSGGGGGGKTGGGHSHSGSRGSF